MFFGIIIRMYNNGEHNPPHFHASYQGCHAVFDMNGDLDRWGYAAENSKS